MKRDAEMGPGKAVTREVEAEVMYAQTYKCQGLMASWEARRMPCDLYL